MSRPPLPIRCKRIYEPRADSDGHRVLVDRIWPRGVTRQDAHIDQWLKEIAPSTKLRTWFNHRVDRWPEFETLYRAELRSDGSATILQSLLKIADASQLTLLYSARDEAHNQAVVIVGYLEELRRATG